jgi:hypothetical protein
VKLSLVKPPATDAQLADRLALLGMLGLDQFISVWIEGDLFACRLAPDCPPGLKQMAMECAGIKFRPHRPLKLTPRRGQSATMARRPIPATDNDTEGTAA